MRRIIYSTLVVLVALFSAASCKKSNPYDPFNGGNLTPGPKPDDKPVVLGEWTNAADSTSTAFITRFYCNTNRNGYQGVFSYSEYNRNSSMWNGNNYWQQAHAMAAVVDYYLRIKDSNSSMKSTLEGYFKMWYDKKGNNYEGNASWRGPYGFGNDFTDDTCWIIIALFQLYDATGDETYFTAAKATWDECVWPRSNSSKGGWLPWKMTQPGEFNCCTNGPGAIAAAMLAGYAKKAGQTAESNKYLEQAKKCFSQNVADMTGRNGEVGTVPLSYTQGTCMEAGRLIWRLTGDRSYLDYAILAAKAQMTSGRMNSTYNGQKVARHEGDDENNAIFHAVFYHWAARFATDSGIDAYDKTVRNDLKKYVKRHAELYWSVGIDKANWERSYFSVEAWKPRDIAQGGSQGAYASAAQCFETMCYMDINK